MVALAMVAIQDIAMWGCQFFLVSTQWATEQLDAYDFGLGWRTRTMVRMFSVLCALIMYTGTGVGMGPCLWNSTERGGDTTFLWSTESGDSSGWPSGLLGVGEFKCNSFGCGQGESGDSFGESGDSLGYGEPGDSIGEPGDSLGVRGVRASSTSPK